jgi:hypothetical protein
MPLPGSPEPLGKTSSQGFQQNRGPSTAQALPGAPGSPESGGNSPSWAPVALLPPPLIIAGYLSLLTYSGDKRLPNCISSEVQIRVWPWSGFKGRAQQIRSFLLTRPPGLVARSWEKPGLPGGV